jgi:glycosyltransferase involved in cell wall biosynthesis
MKVLLVSQYFWPESFGINALSRALTDGGVELTVLTGKPNYPDGEVFSGYSAFGVLRETYDGARVIRLPLVPRGKRSSVRLALNYLSFALAGIVFGPGLLRGKQFDAVLVYAPSPLLQALPAIWLSRIKRAPCALWVQDLWPESLSATGFVKSAWILGLIERVVRFIYRHTDVVLVPSEAFRQPIERLGVSPSAIQFYPNAYLDEPLVPHDSEAVNTLAADIASGFSIVFAGNLGTAQALDTVLDAAACLQEQGDDIRFFLIGSGSQSVWLADEVSRRGLYNVVLPGRFPPGAMPLLYASASALLVSLRDEPIFAYTIPSKLQGYLAAGKPVIASLNGEGAKIVVAADAGVGCAAGDADALAQASLSLYRMPADRRAKMGENARRYALQNFSLPRLAADLEATLRKLSARPREK